MGKQGIEGLRNPAEEWIPGAVELTHWRRPPWTAQAIVGMIGEVRVVSSENALGFTIQGGDHANWIALIRGPSGTIHAVPGCKVASITFDMLHNNPDYAIVP